MQFTIKVFCRPPGETKKPPQPRQNLRPQCPDPTQEGREEKKACRRAAERTKNHEKPQFSAAYIQREGHRCHGEEQTVDEVQQIGKTPLPTAPQAQRTQRIVEQGEANAEEQGLSKIRQLPRNLNAHAYPPKMREKKPLTAGASS